jgi:20S proteasome alpha/beta subunit
VLLEKSYDKQVTDEEAQKIVSDAVKAVFNEIKRKTGG